MNGFDNFSFQYFLQALFFGMINGAAASACLGLNLRLQDKITSNSRFFLQFLQLIIYLLSVSLFAVTTIFLIGQLDRQGKRTMLEVTIYFLSMVLVVSLAIWSGWIPRSKRPR